MNSGIRLGRIAGIPVSLHWSLLLIFALITWSLADAVLPSEVAGQSAGLYWLVAAVIAVFFFSSIIAHELAHALVAIRSGQTVEGITLWLFGGVSRLGGDAASPGIEARVAVVGPLTSFALAVVLGVVASALAAAGAAPIWVAGFYWLAAINATLGAFNLLPGFPLDGGRLLRAALWRWSGDRVQATSRAAAAGRTVGLALMLLGLLEFALSGSVVGGLWLVFIGWFLRGAADAERSSVMMTSLLAGVRVRNVMTPDPVTVPAEMTVAEFLWTEPAGHRFTTFPVIADGQVAGLVSLRRILRVPEPERQDTRLADIAEPLGSVAVARPDQPVLSLVGHFGPDESSRVLVMEDGRLTGIVSPRDLLQTVRILAARSGSQ